MTEPDETTCEQLSAWMDGALPAEEARFLERRLQHDDALRAKWERLQLASSCLRGHEVRPMPGLSVRVAAALDAAPAKATARRPWLGWALAASVAALAIAFLPGLVSAPTPAPAPLAVQPAPAPAVSMPEPAVSGPTPGSADFIAQVSPEVPRAEAPAPVRSPSEPTIAASDAAVTTTLSPTEFPLDARSSDWPRAGLAGADPAMEGYLVRHNEMAGGDALGGFVPYLDVVAAGDPDAQEEGDGAAATGPAGQDDPR